MTFQPAQLPSNLNPRNVIKECFKKDLPIRGGWGYTQEDCVILDKNDDTVNKSIPFNGIGYEHLFAEKRLYIELIVSRPENDRYSEIKWSLQKQSLVNSGGKSFDKLIFDVTAFHDSDWEKLKSEFEGPNGIKSPGFDAEAHERKRNELMVKFESIFWFDITSFFGQNNSFTDYESPKKWWKFWN